MFLSETFRGSAPGPRGFRGFHPRALSYFLLVQKATKNTHGRRNPFDGVSPP